LNLYVYVGNNPLKYRDPTGHFPLISWGGFVSDINAYKANQSALDIGSAPVGVVVFVAEDLGFVIQL
jgi:hypothetical protein